MEKREKKRKLLRNVLLGLSAAGLLGVSIYGARKIKINNNAQPKNHRIQTLGDITNKQIPKKEALETMGNVAAIKRKNKIVIKPYYRNGKYINGYRRSQLVNIKQNKSASINANSKLIEDQNIFETKLKELENGKGFPIYDANGDIVSMNYDDIVNKSGLKGQEKKQLQLMLNKEKQYDVITPDLFKKLDVEEINRQSRLLKKRSDIDLTPDTNIDEFNLSKTEDVDQMLFKYDKFHDRIQPIKLNGDFHQRVQNKALTDYGATKEEGEALVEYVGNYYSQVNSHLINNPVKKLSELQVREGITLKTNSELKNIVNNIDNLLQKRESFNNRQVYRYLLDLDDNHMKKFLEVYKPGKEVIEKRFMSTSADAIFTEKFHRHAKVQIHISTKKNWE